MRRLKVQMQWFYWVPKKCISRVVGWFAHCRCRHLSRYLIRWYQGHFKISLDEAVSSNVADYASLNDFFTRALKPGARPIDTQPQVIVSPCDGVIGQIGHISGATLVQAKGQHYTLDALMAGLGDGVSPFINGRYVTIYLAPQDYHRVHMPMTAALVQMKHVPGNLFPVFPKAVSSVNDLYIRNERVLFWFETDRGPMVIAMVGALNVGSVTVTGYGQVSSSKRTASEWNYAEPISFQKGDELAYFNMGGSCVITLFPEDMVEWQQSLQLGDSVLMGQGLSDIRQL